MRASAQLTGGFHWVSSSTNARVPPRLLLASGACCPGASPHPQDASGADRRGANGASPTSTQQPGPLRPGTVPEGALLWAGGQAGRPFLCLLPPAKSLPPDTSPHVALPAPMSGVPGSPAHGGFKASVCPWPLGSGVSPACASEVSGLMVLTHAELGPEA